MVGLASCIAGTLLQTADYSGKFFPNLGDMPVFGVLLLCILICAIFGLINGIVIAYLNVPAFIGTLGMQLAVYGICLVYTNATPVSYTHLDVYKRQEYHSGAGRIRACAQLSDDPADAF